MCISATKPKVRKIYNSHKGLNLCSKMGSNICKWNPYFSFDQLQWTRLLQQLHLHHQQADRLSEIWNIHLSVHKMNKPMLKNSQKNFFVTEIWTADFLWDKLWWRPLHHATPPKTFFIWAIDKLKKSFVQSFFQKIEIGSTPGISKFIC